MRRTPQNRPPAHKKETADAAETAAHGPAAPSSDDQPKTRQNGGSVEKPKKRRKTADLRKKATQNRRKPARQAAMRPSHKKENEPPDEPEEAPEYDLENDPDADAPEEGPQTAEAHRHQKLLDEQHPGRAIIFAIAKRRASQATGPRSLAELAAKLKISQGHLTDVMAGRRRLTRDVYNRLIEAMPELKIPWPVPDLAVPAPPPVRGEHRWEARRGGRARYCTRCLTFQLRRIDFPCPGEPRPGVHTWGLIGKADTLRCTVCHVARHGHTTTACPGPPPPTDVIPDFNQLDPKDRPKQPSKKDRLRAEVADLVSRAAAAREARIESRVAQATETAANKMALALADYPPGIFAPPGKDRAEDLGNYRGAAGGRVPTRRTLLLVDLLLYIARTTGVLSERVVAEFDLRGTPHADWEHRVWPQASRVKHYIQRVSDALPLSKFRIYTTRGKLVVNARDTASLRAWLDQWLARNNARLVKPRAWNHDHLGAIACTRNYTGARIDLPGYQAEPVRRLPDGTHEYVEYVETQH